MSLWSSHEISRCAFLFHECRVAFEAEAGQSFAAVMGLLEIIYSEILGRALELVII